MTFNPLTTQLGLKNRKREPRQSSSHHCKWQAYRITVNHISTCTDPSVVYRHPSEAVGRTFDYIVCANKAINPQSIPPLFKDVVGDQTTLVLMQNGVGNEEPFRHEYPRNTILSGVVWVGGVQSTPGIIHHTKNEDTQLGLFPNSSLDEKVEGERLDTFTGLLRKGGTKFTVHENIQIQRWEKVVWNAAWNPLTTLTGIDTQVSTTNLTNA